MSVYKIVSGGQTGADQGGLTAAVVLGLRTGGWMPKGWKTENGPNPSLAGLGLKEHSSAAYQPRTRLNVRESDGTLVFGNSKSPGSKLTLSTCGAYGKPSFVVPWRSGQSSKPSRVLVKLFRQWLDDNDIEVLNVAGNRESGQPGIAKATSTFLIAALS